MTEDSDFIDAEQYSSGKIKVTFRDIVLNQLKRISNNANVEFRGGYWESRDMPLTLPGGVVKVIQNKVYVPDTREIYSNSVMHLVNLVYPHADDAFKKAVEDCEKEIKESLPKTEDDKDKKFEDIDERTQFRTKRRELLEKLFREVSCFLKRMDYFAAQQGDDVF